MSVAAIAALVVGATFLVSGVAKLARPQLWREQAAALGAPRFVVGVLPVVELAIGALLVVQWQRTIVAIAAAVLLDAFTLLLVLNIARGRRPPCACFGALSARPIGWRHVLRNMVLIALSIVAAVG